MRSFNQLMQFNLETEFQKAEEKLIIVRARQHLAETKGQKHKEGEKKSALILATHHDSSSMIRTGNNRFDKKVKRLLLDQFPDNQK